MRITLGLIIACFFSACATGPDQFAKSMNSEFGLKSYTVKSLDDSQFKAKVSFIYTLLANTEELRIHQFNAATDNEVYVNDDSINGGYPEIVVKFDRDENGNKIDGTGKHVRDCENMGSFNYKHPQREPLGHFAQDMLPWIKLGNCREDTATVEQRISAYVLDIELGLERLVAAKVSYYLPNGFNFQNSGQSETVAFFLEALDKTGFNVHGFILNDLNSSKKRNEFYKSLEQGINEMI